MHNRKKPDGQVSENEKKAVLEKATKYKVLVESIFDKRQSKDASNETLIFLGKVLKANPDFYSLWNMRREILLTQYPQLLAANSENKVSLNDVRDEELRVSADGIMKNPKCYGAWHHRLWIADRLEMDYESELNLCKDFLLADQRNFHCWNYRRSIHERSGRPVAEEFDYSTEKIEENFSNYSAFHHRSVYISSKSEPLPTLLESELSIVENAIYTEPDDQSGWWYQQFLMTWALSQSTGEADLGWLRDITLSQLKAIQGLLEIETESRWAMNSIIFLIDYLEKVKPLATSPSLLETDASYGFPHELSELRTDLLNKLCFIDPLHINRYKYLLSKVKNAVN